MSPECDLLLWAAADNGSISNLELLRNHISFLGTIFDKVRAREDLRGGTNGYVRLVIPKAHFDFGRWIINGLINKINRSMVA
ncbi:hypothetical protein TNCT_183031 [Trichonephila clavata]|uniref:Uncharacterized protein n=1 Tax=Trichonephila clavata TaxID=2740835 RepID=A0A8X6HGJ9_TRICU|nr:hypothetical protein TNCT_183031 [Trichonephila clavata]